MTDQPVNPMSDTEDRLGDFIGENGVAARNFLDELATRACASEVLDGAWWMALSSMLIDGWRIIEPKP